MVGNYKYKSIYQPICTVLLCRSHFLTAVMPLLREIKNVLSEIESLKEVVCWLRAQSDLNWVRGLSDVRLPPYCSEGPSTS